MINRQRSQNIIFQIFSRIPFSLLGRLTRTNLIIPYYHIVCDEEISHVKHLYRYKTIREFREDIDFLLKTYSPMGLIDLLIYMKNGRSLPVRDFLLKFDDRYRGIGDIVATIFLVIGVCSIFLG